VTRVQGDRHLGPSSLPPHLPSPPLHLVRGTIGQAGVRLPAQLDVEVLRLQPHVPRRQGSAWGGGKQQGIRQHRSALHGPAPWPCCTGLPALHRHRGASPRLTAPRFRQTPTPCQAQASTGCQRRAEHPRPAHLLHTLEHPICGPTTGISTLTCLLATLGFSFPSHLEDRSVPSSLQVPSVGLGVVLVFPPPHCRQGHPWPAAAAPEQDLPRSRVQLARDRSRLRAGLIPPHPVHLPPARHCHAGCCSERTGVRSCSATRKHDGELEPEIREQTVFSRSCGRCHPPQACLANRGCVPSYGAEVEAGRGPPAAPRDRVKQQRGRCVCRRDLRLHPPLSGSLWRSVLP